MINKVYAVIRTSEEIIWINNIFDNIEEAKKYCDLLNENSGEYESYTIETYPLLTKFNNSNFYYNIIISEYDLYPDDNRVISVEKVINEKHNKDAIKNHVNVSKTLSNYLTISFECEFNEIDKYTDEYCKNLFRKVKDKIDNKTIDNINMYIKNKVYGPAK